MKKRHIALLILLVVTSTQLFAQRLSPDARKNTIVRQYITHSETSTPVLDNVTTYDAQGRKIEEIEYASYGQKERMVYEYEGNSDRASRIIEYNDKNSVVRIKKIEYNADGSRHKVYTYSPKGKLKSTKTYEYSKQ